MENINKIVVIGVKYDSNLGDMLLGDCLCHLLSKEIPNANIDYIDMRGRAEVDNNVYNNSSFNNLYRKIRHLGGMIVKSCLPHNSLPNENVLTSFFENILRVLLQ